MKWFVSLLFVVGFCACSQPVCKTNEDLEKHDGKQVYVEGKLGIPNNSKYPIRLELAEGIYIFLVFLKNKPRECLDGENIRVKGTLFYKQKIPAKYNLTLRTNTPYLLDIESVEKIE